MGNTRIDHYERFCTRCDVTTVHEVVMTELVKGPRRGVVVTTQCKRCDKGEAKLA